MQKIAICEDEKLWMEQLIEILNSINTEGALIITPFHSGEEFLLDFAPEKYDLIFMDIYMHSLTGVETISRLREIDKDVPVVFTTTSKDHALEAYRLNVMKYLEKPINRDEVIECLNLASLKKSRQKPITLVISGKEHSFSERSILYLEQLNHSVVLHLSDHSKISCSGKLDDFELNLPLPPFFRCHKSYIVNLANVTSLNYDLKMFVLKDGSNAYIRRDKLKDARLVMDQYLFEQLRKHG